jgi:hypothetical protein
MLKVLIADFDALAFFSFLETSPYIFRHFRMRDSPQMAFERLDGRGGKLL